MKLASVRIVTADLDRLVVFYELLTGIKADRSTPMFAELVSSSGTLAICDAQTVAAPLRPADNHSVILEWEVSDVDAEYARLKTEVHEWIQTPTDMPWGNRSALLRDPDGNVLNLYTPVTDEAKQHFAGR